MSDFLSIKYAETRALSLDLGRPTYPFTGDVRENCFMLIQRRWKDIKYIPQSKYMGDEDEMLGRLVIQFVMEDTVVRDTVEKDASDEV